jgi:hypothetical protein
MTSLTFQRAIVRSSPTPMSQVNSDSTSGPVNEAEEAADYYRIRLSVLLWQKRHVSLRACNIRDASRATSIGSSSSNNNRPCERGRRGAPVDGFRIDGSLPLPAAGPLIEETLNRPINNVTGTTAVAACPSPDRPLAFSCIRLGREL